MTKEDLLNYQLNHAKGGTGWACVQFDPEGDGRFVRVMSATQPQKERQAFLAAITQLEVLKLSPGLDANKNPYPSEPKKLTPEQLELLKPFRDGIADGSLQIVQSHVLPAKKTKTAALV